MNRTKFLTGLLFTLLIISHVESTDRAKAQTRERKRTKEQIAHLKGEQNKPTKERKLKKGIDNEKRQEPQGSISKKNTKDNLKRIENGDRDLQLVGAGILALVTAVSLSQFVATVLTIAPTKSPSAFPFAAPSSQPSTSEPPSRLPSQYPSRMPTDEPTKSALPSLVPTTTPTINIPSTMPSGPATVINYLDRFLRFMDFLWYEFFLGYVE